MGLLELTYRCGLDCAHCYCKGSENKGKELSLEEWKDILDTLHREGCLWLTLSGGDPCLREDFLRIYAYAKQKGFLIALFTNGQAFSDELIDYLAHSPPHLIEITLNGITRETYEAISRKEGSYQKAMAAVKLLAAKNLPLVIKTNCLKQNKDELVRIKQWTENLLGKPQGNRHFFKYDTMIYPRLNGDTAPCRHRLSAEEMLTLRKEDAEIWAEYQEGLHHTSLQITGDGSFLYRCNVWETQFFINPYGRLKFCQWTERFSVDLRATSFAEGFYNLFPRVRAERFKTGSRCRGCSRRAVCYFCPPRAYLETGNEETPVPYYCALAEAAEKQIRTTAL